MFLRSGTHSLRVVPLLTSPTPVALQTPKNFADSVERVR
jgi:hypothetical protein